MGSLQRMIITDYTYFDINQSKWFKDLTKNACGSSERNGNRIYIYFKSKENAEECIEKCIQRNISNVGILENCYYNTFRVDILMNWKERRPSRLRKRQQQILN